MASYIARFDESEYVVGTQSTPEDLVVLPPQFDPLFYRLIDEATYLMVNAGGFRHKPGPGPYRWQWNGSAIVELPDTRYILDVTFSDFTYEIGDPGVQITLVLLDSNQIPTGFNGKGRMLVSMGDGRPHLYSIQFTNGTRTVPAFTPNVTGMWTVEATAQYWPRGDLELEVVEVL